MIATGTATLEDGAWTLIVLAFSTVTADPLSTVEPNYTSVATLNANPESVARYLPAVLPLVGETDEIV